MGHISLWLPLNGPYQLLVDTEWATLACGCHWMGHINFWLTLNGSH